MASGTIRRHGFGTSSPIGLPWTASADGVVNLRLSSSAISGAAAYMYISRNGTLYAAWNGNANGGAYSICFPVNKNDEIAIYASSNIDGHSFTFFPLI